MMPRANDKLIYLDDIGCESDRHPHVTVARLSDVIRLSAFKNPIKGMCYTITLRPGKKEDDTYYVDKALWDLVRCMLKESVGFNVEFLGRTVNRIGDFLEGKNNAASE